MNQVITFLQEEENINSANIICIDKEDLKYDFIKTYEDLNDYIKKLKLKIKGKKYLFIDEIQDIVDWEKTIRSYAKKEDFDIYITGSNSNLLSGELSTFLTGRYVEINIYPLTFKEFLLFRGDKVGDFKEEFNNYMKYGGLPAIHMMKFEDEMIYSYISGVFHSILFKDIVSRYKIRNSSLLLDIFKFISDNIGNIVSTKKITDYLKNEKINISNDTLREYLMYFENVFLLDKVRRYDLKGKKILDLLEKYYLGDLGFRNYLLGFKRGDIGQLLENIVYLELKSRGYSIHIGKVNNLEVDFIAEKDGKIEYYQVAYLLSQESTIQREFGVFDSIKDNYPKFVLTLDDFFTEDYNGINRLNIIDWLLVK